MKKLIYNIWILIVLLAVTSCSDFTDVQPKGMNLLTSVDELEMLLNKEYKGSKTDMRVMAGDMIRNFSTLSTQINKPTKSRNVIMWTYDEANMDKMAELTSSDADYTYYYGIIGTIANPILSQIDIASGSDSQKKQIKAEALVLRAWSLYMLVNKFAKAYNPSTASTDPGIIIMTEDKDIQTPQPKGTVQQVYDQILSDANEAIELNSLPDQPVNKMRIGKAAAYCIKAQALLSMQNWEEAESAAKQALAVNGAINDYYEQYLGTKTSRSGKEYPIINRGNKGTDEDYFINMHEEVWYAIDANAWDYFEKGHVYHDKMATMNMRYDYDPQKDYSKKWLGEPIGSYIFDEDDDSKWNDGGLRSTQMYLCIAECEMHKGNIDNSMEYLDDLRSKRIASDYYQPLKGNVKTEDEAIQHIKQVTCNEDLFSVNIFIDKKRWNQLEDWKATYSSSL